MIVRRYFQVEIEDGDNREAGPEEIGFVKTANLGNISACQHTDANTYIPRSEVSGGSCSPLAVGSQVDKQRVVCRKHDTESYSKQQGYDEEYNTAHHIVPPNDVNAC